MRIEEIIDQLNWVKKRISNITYSPDSFEAINLSIKLLVFVEQVIKIMNSNDFPENKEDDVIDLINNLEVDHDFKRT